MPTPRIVLILGSAPSALTCRSWPRQPFTDIVAINNAWAIRDDWNYLIHPDDFPPERHPYSFGPGQCRVTAEDYVPIQNEFGGFVYAGGTMAFTAGYWALGALRPQILAFLGCDMVYPKQGATHFYGAGSADPLREDISLRNLEAKSARLMFMAARAGCHTINLSHEESRLVFPRADRADLDQMARRPVALDLGGISAPLQRETSLGYFVADGRYWREEKRFDSGQIDHLDTLWLDALDATPMRAEPSSM